MSKHMTGKRRNNLKKKLSLKNVEWTNEFSMKEFFVLLNCIKEHLHQFRVDGKHSYIKSTAMHVLLIWSLLFYPSRIWRDCDNDSVVGFSSVSSVMWFPDANGSLMKGLYGMWCVQVPKSGVWHHFICDMIDTSCKSKCDFVLIGNNMHVQKKQDFNASPLRTWS